MRYGDMVRYNGRYFTVGIIADGAVMLWDDEDNSIVVTDIDRIEQL